MSTTSHLSSFPAIWHWLDKNPWPSVVTSLDSHDVVVVPITLNESKWCVDAPGVPQKELLGYLETQTWNKPEGYREYTHEGTHYILVPIPSESGSFSVNRVSRQFGLNTASALSSALKSLKSLAFATHPKLSLPDALEGWIQGLYEYKSLKSTAKSPDWTLESLKIYTPKASEVDALTAALKSRVAAAKAQIITRYLGDTPANLMTPSIFAEIAVELSSKYGFEIEVIDEDKLKEWGMHSLLSVSAGSSNPPKVVIAKVPGTSAASATNKSVALVGKGVTFDSGGISIKPSANMHEMKYDMLGGATVLGALCQVADSQAKLPYDVYALVGLVENMPAYAATRPGDVVASYSGKTIEILNTDAEGRLVLADLLEYAQKDLGAGAVINAATLTGACLVALGSVGAALLSHSPEWKKFLLKTAEEQGEPLWELPLWSDLSKAMESTVADVKNIASPGVRAGTITAGIFLSQFVRPETPWAHFDIAGVGWSCQSLGYPKKGASGYGVNTLASAALEAGEFYKNT